MRMDGEGHEEDKIIVRSNGTVTYVGKDVACQLWKLGLLDQDFRYEQFDASQRSGLQLQPEAGPITRPSRGQDGLQRH